MEILRRLREEKNLTQEQTANELGISKSYYVKIENGFMKPSYKVMKSLKEYYGEELDLNELVK